MEKDLTIEDLRRMVGPVAEKNRMDRVWLLHTREDSCSGNGYGFCIRPARDCGIMQMSGFLIELKRAFGHDVDVVAERDLRIKLGPDAADKLVLLFSSGSS